MIERSVAYFRIVLLLFAISLYVAETGVFTRSVWSNSEIASSPESSSETLTVDFDCHADEHKVTNYEIINYNPSQPFYFSHLYYIYNAPDRKGVWQPPRNI